MVIPIRKIRKRNNQISRAWKFSIFTTEYPDSLSQKGQRSLRFKKEFTDLKWQIDYLTCFTKPVDLSLMNLMMWS